MVDNQYEEEEDEKGGDDNEGTDSDDDDDDDDDDGDGDGDDGDDNDDDHAADDVTVHVDNEPHVDDVAVEETSTSSSGSGSSDDNDDSSQDFGPDHYDQLAKLPRVIPTVSKAQDEADQSTRDVSDERIQALETQVSGLQSQVDDLLAREAQRAQTINDQNKVLAEMRILVNQLVERLDPQGEKAHNDKTTCHGIGIQKNPDDDDEPSAGDGFGEHQHVASNPSLTQGESEVIVEANMMTSGDNEANDANMLDNSLFFEDSDMDEADKIECLIDLDDLSDDDTEEEGLEEGEIVEVELECDNKKVVYEGCEGLIDTDVFEDDVIPEGFSEGVVESDASDPDLEKQNSDSAESLPKDTEMYKNTGMTKAQWMEMV
ncbi:hypothetical protein L1987_74423 [Smallanthus sonchifolius]|uniref:Uncharacterized protein n=1 Tax=Smallanthus sonchifolius TaxID=185202 RepID=A0ACB9A474_9ASTR|nr:hypothetical protein L1987_74423 [Smallanthus sonchifolius]